MKIMRASFASRMMLSWVLSSFNHSAHLNAVQGSQQVYKLFRLFLCKTISEGMQ